MKESVTLPRWKTPLGNKLRTLLLAAVVLHFIVVFSVLFENPSLIWPLHNDTIHRLGPAADFFAVYHAAVNVNLGISPYENNADGITPPYYPFRYLPVVAYAAQPLLLLSPFTAWVLWTVVLEALLFLLIFTLRNHLRTPGLWAFVSTLLLLSSPYFLEIHMGQFTFATVTLFALAMLLSNLLSNRLFFHAAILLKVFPLAAAPTLLRSGRWRTVVEAIVILLAVSLPYFLVNPVDFGLFVDANFRPTGGMDAGNFGFIRLLYLLAADLHLDVALIHWDAVVATGRLVVLAACCTLVLLSRSTQPLLGAVMLLLAHFVTYMHVWEHHLSGILVLGALLLTLPGLSKRDEKILLGALVLCALPTPFYFFDTVRDMQVWDPSTEWPRYMAYAVVLCKVVPTLTLFLWCAARLRNAGLALPRWASPLYFMRTRF